MLCFHAKQAVAQTPTIIYVDSAVMASGTGVSWTSPLKTLSEGLWKAHAVSGPVQVWVRRGTYYPMQSPTMITDNRDSSFTISRNNLKVYGGFAGTETAISERIPGINTTILSGDIGFPYDYSDNSVHVVKIVTYPVTVIDSATMLDGLTITGGNANGATSNINFTIGGKPYAIINNRGGGLYIFCNGAGHSCTPLINNCSFNNNSAANAGGVENDGVEAMLNATYTNCKFIDNGSSGGGGAWGSESASATIKNCYFLRNNGGNSGGAISFLYNSSTLGTLTLENNTFESNLAYQGGAVFMRAIRSNLFAGNNIFTGNNGYIYGGGAMYLDLGSGKSTLVNNLFLRNQATSPTTAGGALKIVGGNGCSIINNTFFANSAASGRGGALCVENTGIDRQLFNNIFYYNYAGTAVSDTSLPFGYSLAAQGNNTFSNMPPGFVDESNPIGPDGIWGTGDDGLRLGPCSPYINTGNNSKNPMSQDLAGNNRIFGGIIDPGVYELQTPAAHIRDTIRAGICKDDSLLFNGIYYKMAQTHTDSFHTVAGCDSFKTLILTIRPATAPVVITPLSYCIATPANALAASGIAPTDTLLWYTIPTGGIGTKIAPTPNTSVAGITIYYVSSRSALGCESPRAAITVQTNPLPAPPAVISPVSYCIGSDAVPLNAGKESPSDVLLWYNSVSGGTSSTAAPVPATNALGTNTWYVSSRSAAGCESERKAITIHVFPQTLPALGLSPDNVLLCKGHHIMLYCTPVDAFYNYTWFKDGVEMGLPPGTTATPVGEAGIYQVRVADTAGCADRTINVSVSFYPTVVKPHINRMGTTLRLDHGYPQYQWYRNNKLIAGATAISCPLSFDGSYYAMVMDANGCTSVSDTITLNSLGMDETKVTGHDIRIYPNPTQNTVFIDAPQPVNISVKDVTGRVVMTLQNAAQADLGNYADGMYLFYLTDGDNKSIGVEKVYKTSTR
jgi:hypothetical protein